MASQPRQNRPDQEFSARHEGRIRTAYQPTSASAAAWAAIDELANEYVAADPGLSITAARADAMMDLLLQRVDVQTTVTLAVPTGQTEAARSLGLSPRRTFVDVVFPQAFKIALPPLVNNIVALLKDSSLAYVIGVVELSNIGNRVQAATFQPVPVFIATASIYLVLTTVLTQISGAIEARLDIEQRGH